MSSSDLRFDKEFPLDTWIALFHASDFNWWWKRRHAEAAIGHRYLVITAWDQGRMVGTLSVESDGVNFALIDDVVVHPQYRKRGIGTRLVHAALARLAPLELVHVQVQPIPGRESFFERFGFVVQERATIMDLSK